ncbi:unnamed protein product, partial [Ectocarpus fasciculatus]
ELTWEYINKAENEFLYHEIFEQNTYLQYGITVVEGDVVVDAGANIGLFSLLCSAAAPALKIIAIEPIPAIFDVLRRNLGGVETASVCLINAAIGNPVYFGQDAIFSYYRDSPGESTRRVDERSARRTQLNQAVATHPLGQLRRGLEESMQAGGGEDEAVESCTCKVVTLQDVIARSGVSCIDLLKIDVEGDELEALMSLKDSWHKVRQIVMEVYDKSNRLGETVELLKRQGFAVTTKKQ